MVPNVVRLLSGLFLTLWVAAGIRAQDFNVNCWNLESSGASIETLCQQIREMQGNATQSQCVTKAALWGFCEVQASWAPEIAKAVAVEPMTSIGSILGSTGRSDRLLITYDRALFELVSSVELQEINIEGRVRAPLAARFKLKSGFEFWFVVNHLYRSNAEKRNRQSKLLNQWARAQLLPVILGGDFNYDFNPTTRVHDAGFDTLLAENSMRWVEPSQLLPTQCGREGLVLDFFFVARWPAAGRLDSSILRRAGDFPDTPLTSDHRPLLLRVWVQRPTADSIQADIEALEQQLVQIERAVREARLLLELLKKKSKSAK